MAESRFLTFKASCKRMVIFLLIQVLYTYIDRDRPKWTQNNLPSGNNGEEAKWCILAPCGIAATDIALSIFNDPNDPNDPRPYIFYADIYSGTIDYATDVLQDQRGVNVKFVKSSDSSSTTSDLIKAIEDNPPVLVFIEPITNPYLNIIDIPAVVQAAHQHGAYVIVDNTFATPYLFHPLDAGADLVVHSASKYLGGHNNILAGVIGVNDPDLRARLLTHRNMIGSVLSPDDAGRLKTQLMTFPIRLNRQNETAIKIAEYLENHPAISKVRFPGLPSHAGHILARKI